ncbi:CPS1 [Bugula neritina]|uniref:CPS1 n=1 Tax=Bugula neritina TaxID=10212 RepID=A0A7J7J1C0_BUGNE|nr:CPS1 [Bugula neritina]
MQFLVTDDNIMVIELNLRASRTCPFVSKTIGTDLVKVATKVMVGAELDLKELPTLETPHNPVDYVGIKAPMFSWPRLRDADPLLRCEMSSTGEVACFAPDVHTAFLKSLISAGFKLPPKGGNIMIGIQQSFQPAFLPTAKKLHDLGYKLCATEATAEYLNKHNIPADIVGWPASDNTCENVGIATKLIQEKAIDLVINLPNNNTKYVQDNYMIRRMSIDSQTPLVTNFQIAKLLTESLAKEDQMRPDSLFHYQKRATV